MPYRVLKANPPVPLSPCRSPVAERQPRISPPPILAAAAAGIPPRCLFRPPSSPIERGRFCYLNRPPPPLPRSRP